MSWWEGSGQARLVSRLSHPGKFWGNHGFILLKCGSLRLELRGVSMTDVVGGSCHCSPTV